MEQIKLSKRQQTVFDLITNGSYTVKDLAYEVYQKSDANQVSNIHYVLGQLRKKNIFAYPVELGNEVKILSDIHDFQRVTERQKKDVLGRMNNHVVTTGSMIASYPQMLTTVQMWNKERLKFLVDAQKNKFQLQNKEK